MNYDAVIFDIDGTLWNVSSQCAKGWENALSSIGKDVSVTAEDIESVMGRPFDECVESLFPGVLEDNEGLLEKISRAEIECIEKEGGTFYDGVLEQIPLLSKKVDVYMLSNCQERYMHIFLDQSGLRKVISGFDCNGMSDLPKDAMLRNMKEKYSLHNPLYVGDTAGDEAATAKAGVDFLYASYGFGTPNGNPKTANSFFEVLNYIKSHID